VSVRTVTETGLRLLSTFRSDKFVRMTERGRIRYLAKVWKIEMSFERSRGFALFAINLQLNLSGFSARKSFGMKMPSLRISSPSNHTSPPPHSLRWINTMSQCTAERLPLSATS
jgi:hypothetical protein